MMRSPSKSSPLLRRHLDRLLVVLYSRRNEDGGSPWISRASELKSGLVPGSIRGRSVRGIRQL
jgi:hypothetical protein